MADELMLMITDDGVAEVYDDTYDITIHCTSEEEQKKAVEVINGNRWVPCKERPPEEDGDYWVTVDPDYVPPGYRSVDCITWHNGKWVMADFFVLDGQGRKKPDYKVVDFELPIIAWMPLPKEYREGDAE